MILISVGLTLHGTSMMSAALAIVCTVVLGSEMLISFARHTTRAAIVDKSYDSLFELRVESIIISSNRIAYWVQGRLVPILKITGTGLTEPITV